MKFLPIVLLIIYISICYSSSTTKKTGGGKPHPHTTHAPTTRTKITPKTIRTTPRPHSQTSKTPTRTTSKPPIRTTSLPTRRTTSTPPIRTTSVPTSRTTSTTSIRTTSSPTIKASTHPQNPSRLPDIDYTPVTQPYQSIEKKKTTISPNYDYDYDHQEIPISTGVNDQQRNTSIIKIVIDETLSVINRHKESLEDFVYQTIKQTIPGNNVKSQLNKTDENNQEVDTINKSRDGQKFDPSDRSEGLTQDENIEENRLDVNGREESSSENTINKSRYGQKYDYSNQNRSKGFTLDENIGGNRLDGNTQAADSSENAITKLNEEDDGQTDL